MNIAEVAGLTRKVTRGQPETCHSKVIAQHYGVLREAIPGLIKLTTISFGLPE